MHRSAVRRVAIFALALQTIALPATAIPVVSVHWGDCPFLPGDPINRGPGDAGTESITVTATGLSGTIKGIHLWLRLASGGGGGIADAWRFEPGGCEAGHLVLNSVPPEDPCPMLLGAHPQSFSDIRYRADLYYGAVYASESIGSAILFDPFLADPAKTYTLARFRFDRANVFLGGGSRSDSCGCYERPICILLQDTYYLDADNQEHYIAVSREFLSWNDPGNSLSCPFSYTCDGPCPWTGDSLCVVNGPTPVRTRSWGSVKASYR